ncbi:hypothetical protein TorRG33x02_288390 [Trema orientale]|uniref:Uncharacterized protein n=1 Tax=Trema orientale TaxID=63057 RepID=A0A2P5CEC5_TREOI|nr:hypothetical protein TorRG33x02_288390 [Trema orientale]
MLLLVLGGGLRVRMETWAGCGPALYHRFDGTSRFPCFSKRFERGGFWVWSRRSKRFCSSDIGGLWVRRGRGR